jgi:hypothetical protein
MGVPNSEVGYTAAMPREEVHKDMWWHWNKKKQFSCILIPFSEDSQTSLLQGTYSKEWYACKILGIQKLLKVHVSSSVWICRLVNKEWREWSQNFRNVDNIWQVTRRNIPWASNINLAYWHCKCLLNMSHCKKVKLKQSHYRPRQALRVLRKLRFPDFMTTAQDGGKVVSLRHRPPLPPGNTPGTHFCYRLSRPQGHSAIGRILCQRKIHWHQLGSSQRHSDL